VLSRCRSSPAVGDRPHDERGREPSGGTRCGAGTRSSMATRSYSRSEEVLDAATPNHGPNVWQKSSASGPRRQIRTGNALIEFTRTFMVETRVRAGIRPRGFRLVNPAGVGPSTPERTRRIFPKATTSSGFSRTVTVRLYAGLGTRTARQSLTSATVSIAPHNRQRVHDPAARCVPWRTR